MRIAVIALRNAADARINTSSVIRPSHSNLSPSVIIPYRARLAFTPTLVGEAPRLLGSTRVSILCIHSSTVFIRQAGQLVCRTLACYPLFFPLDRFLVLWYLQC